MVDATGAKTGLPSPRQLSARRRRPAARRLRLISLALALVAASAGTRGARADDLWTKLSDSDQLRAQRESGHPEAIAALSALVQHEEALAPGYLMRVLRGLVEDKSGARTDPLVRAQAAYLLSLEQDRAGDSGAADARRRAMGLVGDGWVLGPFDAQGRSGLDDAYPVERDLVSIDPSVAKTYAGKQHDIAWRRLVPEAFVQGAIFLDAMVRPDSDAAAYVLFYAQSDRDRSAALRMGSAGPIKAWVNGREVAANDVVRPAWPDQDAIPVFLHRGSNAILVKTVITRGAWRLFARLTRPDGTALTGVTITATPAHTPIRLGSRRSGKVRDLGALLGQRAEHASAHNAARAWLDQALYLALVMSSDADAGASEAAAKKAVSETLPAKDHWDGTTLMALLLLGDVAKDADDRRTALERALTTLTAPDDRAWVLARIGLAWRSQHRDDIALGLWRKAVALDPDCFAAQVALARAEENAGMPAGALARLSRLSPFARALTPVEEAQVSALTTLGRQREADQIRLAMQRARHTDVGVLRELAAGARARGQLDQAARLYAEAAHWRPDLTGLVLDRAAVLEGKGDVPSAREVLRGAMRRLPDDASLPEELGRLEARAGDIAASVASMQASLKLRPQNPGLRRYMEALISARAVSHQGSDLVAEYAADGQALAREAIFGPSPTDTASAEILLDRTVVRVHGNGLSERFVQRLVHIRTERAARDGQDAWVRYEPSRQEVEIRKARILRKDANGKLETSEATARDERDLSEPWYGLYYDSRAAIVSFENLRAGDVVEMQYTVADVAYRNDLADYFGDFSMVADTLPIRRWDYTLIAPSKRKLYFNHPALPDFGPHTEARGDETVYRFAAEHVARVETEPAMPGFAEIAPYLHVSTYQSWDDVGRWYWNLVADQMQDDGTLRKAAAKATAGLSSTLDKVKALHRLVVESTRYVGLEFGIHGYKPYKSTQVLQRGFGDCKDKATLLMSLLRTVGIDSDLVLLRTRRGGRIDPSPASLAVFDHAIAYVPALDLYIDGTAEFSGLAELPAEDQDTMAVRVSAHGTRLVRTPVISEQANGAERTWHIQLASDGSADVEEALTVTGQAAHEWREHYQTPGERRERYGKVWSGRFAGTVLEDVAMEVSDRNRPVVVHARVRVPQFGDRRGPAEVQLPTSSREADFTSTYARLGQRRFPLVLAYPWHHEETLVYALPAGARAARVPAPRKIESVFGELTLDVQRSPEDRSIEFHSLLVVRKNRIEPSEYPAFRSFLRDIDAALAERLVVQLGGSS
jgi:transglutaminase-like putative cysteine protease